MKKTKQEKPNTSCDSNGKILNALFTLLIFMILLNACRKPEDKIIPYGAKTDGKAFKENVKSSLNDKDVKSVTIKSEENFNLSLAPEMSEHNKVLWEAVRLGQIKVSGRINALEITQGALDSLKQCGWEVTGKIIEHPTLKDTLLYFSANADIEIAMLNALNARPDIKDINIRSAENFQTQGVAEMVVHTSKAKAIAGVGGKIKFDRTKPVNPYKIHPTQQAELEAFFNVTPLTEFYRDVIALFSAYPSIMFSYDDFLAWNADEEIRHIILTSNEDFHLESEGNMTHYASVAEYYMTASEKMKSDKESVVNPPVGNITPDAEATLSKYFKVIPGYMPGKSKGYKNNAINQRGYGRGGRGS